MIGADGRAHMGVATVKQHAEIWIAFGPHAIDDLEHLGWLVEHKPRLEFKADVHAKIGRDLATLVPRADDPLHAELGIHLRGLEETRRFDRIDTNCLDAKIA